MALILIKNIHKHSYEYFFNHYLQVKKKRKDHEIKIIQALMHTTYGASESTL